MDGQTHDPFIRGDGGVVEAILAGVENRPVVAWVEAGPQPSSATPLTPRERDVLRAVVDGAPNKVIATRLGVSVATVERHLSNLYRKLDVGGRAEAAVWAVRDGLVDP